jgi:hypothetical protein
MSPGTAKFKAEGEAMLDIVAVAFACGSYRLSTLVWQAGSNGINPITGDYGDTRAHHDIEDMFTQLINDVIERRIRDQFDVQVQQFLSGIKGWPTNQWKVGCHDACSATSCHIKSNETVCCSDIEAVKAGEIDLVEHIHNAEERSILRRPRIETAC